jgi:hypothetical protein
MFQMQPFLLELLDPLLDLPVSTAIPFQFLLQSPALLLEAQSLLLLFFGPARAFCPRLPLLLQTLRLVRVRILNELLVSFKLPLQLFYQHPSLFAQQL